MSESWQVIPNSVLEQEDADNKATEWANKQRSSIAGLWAQQQQGWLSEYRARSPTPKPPAEVSFNPEDIGSPHIPGTSPSQPPLPPPHAAGLTPTGEVEQPFEPRKPLSAGIPEQVRSLPAPGLPFGAGVLADVGKGVFDVVQSLVSRKFLPWFERPSQEYDDAKEELAELEKRVGSRGKETGDFTFTPTEGQRHTELRRMVSSVEKPPTSEAPPAANVAESIGQMLPVAIGILPKDISIEQLASDPWWAQILMSIPPTAGLRGATIATKAAPQETKIIVDQLRKLPIKERLALIKDIPRDLAVGEAGQLKESKALEIKGIDKVFKEPKVPPTKKPPASPPPKVPGEPPTSPSLDSPISNAWRTFQEAVTDQTVGIRQLAERVNNPDLINRLNLLPGTARAGLERASLTIRGMFKAAPKAIAGDVNELLQARHALEVFKAKPKRAAVGTFKTAKEAQTALKDLTQRLGTEGSIEADKAALVIKKAFSENLQRRVDGGLVTKELGEELTKKYPWYNPTHLLEYLDKQVTSRRPTLRISNATSGIQRLAPRGKAGEVENSLEAMTNLFVHTELQVQKNAVAKGVIQAALKDKKLKSLVRRVKERVPVAQVEEEVIFRPRGPKPGEITYMERGKRVIYEVPEWLAKEMTNLNTPNELTGLIGRVNNISRLGFIDYNPSFFVSNSMIDALTAFVREGTLPTSTLKESIRYLRGLADDPVLQVYRLTGAEQMRFYRQSPQEVRKLIRGSGGKVVNTPLEVGKTIKDFLPNVGQAGEQGPRLAVFRKHLNKSLPGWEKMNPLEVAKTPQAREAGTKALEATINFSRGGYLTKQANMLVLFANAAVQGTLIPGRTISQNPAGRWRLAGLVGIKMGLDYYNTTYPEYFDIPSDLRYGTMLIMLPSMESDIKGRKLPNYITLVPRIREWGQIFSPLTHIMEKMVSDKAPGFGEFMQIAIPNAGPMGDLPAPEILQTMFGHAANWDFFRQRPIVPRGLEGEEPKKQYTQYTSTTLIEMGEKLGLSPLYAQHWAGLVGGGGKMGLSVSDFILSRFLTPGPDSEALGKLEEAIMALPPENREKALSALPVEVRKLVEDEARKPEAGIPILSDIARRFRPKRASEPFIRGIQNEKYRLKETRASLDEDVSRWLDKVDIRVPVVSSTIQREGKLRRLSDDELQAAQGAFVKLLNQRILAVANDLRFQGAKTLQQQKALKKVISGVKSAIGDSILKLIGRQEVVAP